MQAAVDVRYPAAVDAFWRSLTDSAGCRSVATIASEIGLSRRHLSQRVRTDRGLVPTVAARPLRFAEARRCLRSGQAKSLAEATVMCGYFDQAHLTHDWNQFGGCTPGTWISEELPFLQDLGSAHGGD